MKNLVFTMHYFCPTLLERFWKWWISLHYLSHLKLQLICTADLYLNLTNRFCLVIPWRWCWQFLLSFNNSYYFDPMITHTNSHKYSYIVIFKFGEEREVHSYIIHTIYIHIIHTYIFIHCDIYFGEERKKNTLPCFKFHETSRFRCIYWWVSFYSMFLIIPKYSSEYLPKYIFHRVLSTSKWVHFVNVPSTWVL